MKTTRLDPDKCLDCGSELDAVSSVEGDFSPEPGDATICLKCGHVMCFDDNMRVRPPTDDEMHELAGHPEILKIQHARGRLFGR